MISFEALLINKEEIAPGIFFLTFKKNGDILFKFKPGQYLIVTIPSGQGSVKRLYSIASPPETQTFSLLIKRVEGGVGSTYLSNLLPGEAVPMSGPAGLFSFQESPAHKIFLTTGTGLAPVKSFISTYKNLPMSLFWGLQTMRDVYFLDFFKKTRLENPLFNYRVCLSRESLLDRSKEKDTSVFFPGRINEALEFYMGSTFQSLGRNSFEYYICGSRAVVDSLKEQLLSSGTEKDHIFFEKY